MTAVTAVTASACPICGDGELGSEVPLRKQLPCPFFLLGLPEEPPELLVLIPKPLELASFSNFRIICSGECFEKFFSNHPFFPPDGKDSAGNTKVCLYLKT